MLPFQLEASALLASGAAASAIALIWNGMGQKNKIQLPVNAEESFLRDPFDIVTPEDVVDGSPIGEEQFWARVRGAFNRVSEDKIDVNVIDAYPERCHGHSASSRSYPQRCQRCLGVQG